MLLNELFEDATKHVSFCFGRMNPPTIGHKQVLDTMKAQGGDMKVFVSQTQDKKKNPLDYATKIRFIKEMFSTYANDVVEDASLNTVVKVASHLYDQGYTAVTLVAGSDRLEDMKKLLDTYNGVEGKSHGYYKFDMLDFVSSGEREDGAEGVAGVSASAARAAAANGDVDAFREATGAGELSPKLYAAVRKGMGINEGFDDFEDYPLDRKLTKKQIKNIQDNRDLDDIINSLQDKFSEPEQKTKKGVSEAPIELDPADPMDPMIYGHDQANPGKLKYRMSRAARQLKDLAGRVDGAAPEDWQTMARQFDELKMNMEQIRHALEELSKIRKKGGIRSRGITV